MQPGDRIVLKKQNYAFKKLDKILDIKNGIAHLESGLIMPIQILENFYGRLEDEFIVLKPD